MEAERLVVIGASAGGVRPLEELVAGFRPDFGAPVLIVLHVSPRHRSLLPDILSAAGPVPAQHAQNGETLEPGRIYVAPPDHHLLVDGSQIVLTRGPKENHYRPSIDLLFRSAAYHFGNRATGIVLSGSLSDGSSGLFSIKRAGGIAVIQDPSEAVYSSMPLSALRQVDIDYTLAAAEIGLLLNELVREPTPNEPTGAGPYRLALKQEVDFAAGKPEATMNIVQNHDPSPYTCPDCAGVLFRVHEGIQDRFRCHTGHGFSAAALFSEYFESMEGKLWESLRAMQETILLIAEATHRAAAAGEDEHARVLADTKADLDKRLEILRTLALTQPECGTNNEK
jgi:two-component system chemotaxis response regulator CheB